MNVSEIKTETCADGFIFSATVTSNGRPPTSLWFRTNVPPPAIPTLLGDSFLATLLLPAMRIGESLTIDAPVSARLLKQVPQIQDIFASWVPQARHIDIVAPPAMPIDFPHRRFSGCFFTCGVDSFYTLLKNLRDHPDDSDATTHLVFVEGFDLKSQQVELLKQTRTNLERICEATGKRLVLVSTNMRTLTNPFARWEFQHGAALAAVAHLMPWQFQRITIPSTLAYNQLYPCGSHPLLDPLWSSDQVEILHDGAEASRSDKVTGLVANSPLALQYLRVCWENRNNLYNCGLCEKCLRTMLTLHAVGVLDRCATFQTRLTPALIRAMRIKNPTLLMHAETNLALLESRTDALSRKLARALLNKIRAYRIGLALDVARRNYRIFY